MESYFAEKGLCIIGYYHANERLGDADFGSVARKIADRIFANCPNSCALLVGIQAPTGTLLPFEKNHSLFDTVEPNLLNPKRAAIPHGWPEH